ncbi:MAG: AMP-binding protein [Comamonadaceae bacterium]|nr:AMP-binding protein [Comamonadaceae bacterium]
MLHFDFNDGAIEPRLRRRSLCHFETLLDAVIEDPDRPIAAIDVLVEDERQALAALNATGAVPLPRQSVTEMFEARADRDPDRVAVRQGKTSLTFAALREQSDALAATLLARGIEPGDRVAIAGRRSTLSVLAILGTLRARAAACPDRSLNAAGAPRLRAAGLRRPHLPRRGGRFSCACAAGADGALRRRGDSRRRRGEAGPARTGPGRPRVPDVHVRVDGPAQGRADRPRRPGGLSVLGGAPLRRRRTSHLSAVHLPRVRPHGHQPVPAARSPGGRWRSTLSRTARSIRR